MALAAVVPNAFPPAMLPPIVAKTTGLYLLVVDEDPANCLACCESATQIGYLARGVRNTSEALTVIRDCGIDILLLNLSGSAGAGLDLLAEVKALHPEVAVIVMSASVTVASAVEAMLIGAADLLVKPFAADDLQIVLDRAGERRSFDVESRNLREQLRRQSGLGNIIGRSIGMEKLFRMLSKVAHSDHAALILGETGTGKELVARSIHNNGTHATRPFVTVDCASLAPALIESELFGYVKGAFPGATRSRDGLLVSADNGTVFLDEVAELSLDLQAKLLRALQEKEVRPLGSNTRVPIRARVLAATNRDLAPLVEQGRFRRDLYYRLNIVTLRIPPLRERPGDISLLAAYFLDRLGRKQEKRFRLSDEALRTITDYSWPGNVRELEHAIFRGVSMATGPIIQLGDLTDQVVEFGLQVRRSSLPMDAHETPRHDFASSENMTAGIVPLDVQEREAIISALEQLKGDKLLTAKVLGIGKTTLYRKLKEYEIAAN